MVLNGYLYLRRWLNIWLEVGWFLLARVARSLSSLQGWLSHSYFCDHLLEVFFGAAMKSLCDLMMLSRRIFNPRWGVYSAAKIAANPYLNVRYWNLRKVLLPFASSSEKAPSIRYPIFKNYGEKRILRAKWELNFVPRTDKRWTKMLVS